MKTRQSIAAIILGFVLLSHSLSAQILPTAEPGEVGMFRVRLNRVRPLILEGIERWEYPGAVLLVGRRGRVVFREAFGYFQWFPEERLMDVKSIFDLASLTKPIATRATKSI